jgi:hypothetical protein
MLLALDITAVVIEEIGSAIIKEVPLSKQRQDCILVHTGAVELSPPD